MITTKFGTWINPTTFLDEGETQMRVYTYREVIKEIREFFPFDCFIQLEGNVVKNYVKKE